MILLVTKRDQCAVQISTIPRVLTLDSRYHILGDRVHRRQLLGRQYHFRLGTLGCGSTHFASHSSIRMVEALVSGLVSETGHSVLRVARAVSCSEVPYQDWTSLIVGVRSRRRLPAHPPGLRPAKPSCVKMVS